MFKINLTDTIFATSAALCVCVCECVCVCVGYFSCLEFDLLSEGCNLAEAALVTIIACSQLACIMHSFMYGLLHIALARIPLSLQLSHISFTYYM